jgi:hypothetical protein
MAALLSTSSVLAADAPRLYVGELGQPATFRFEGVSAFRSEELVAALEEDIAFQVAARSEAYFPKLLETIVQRLTLGYSNSGFPRAIVAAEFDAEQSQVVVSVEEGPHYRCGEVRIEGARLVRAERMAYRILHPDDGDEDEQHNPAKAAADDDKLVAWPAGKPASFVRARWKKYEPAIKQALTEQGFPFARYEYRVEPTADHKTAALVVKLLDEGSPDVIEHIEVKGCQRHTADEVLAYLGLKTPLTFSPALVESIDDQLRRTARFIYHKVSTTTPTRPGETLTLSIVLREHPTVPKLDEPLLPWQETMLKLSDWMERWPDSDDDLVIDISDKASDEATATLGHPYTVRIVGAPRKGLLAHFAMQHRTTGKRFESSLLASERRLIISSPLRKARFDFRAQATSRFGLVFNWKEYGTAQQDEKGHNYRIELGAGFHNRDDLSPAIDFTLRFDPVTWIGRFVDSDTQTEWSKRELLLTSANSTLRVDRHTGRPLQLIYEMRDSELRIVVQSEEGAYARAAAELEQATASHADEFDPQRPLGSLGEFLWKEVAHDVDLSDSPQQRRKVEALGRLIKNSLSVTDKLWRQWSARSNLSERFEIPVTEQNGAAAMVASLVLKGSHWAFPRGTPLWALGREIAFQLTGHGRSGPREYAEIARSRTTGPLACLSGALMLKYVDAESSRRFAWHGLQRLEARYCESDCQMLLSGDCLTREVLLEAGDTLRQFDDESLELLARLAAKPPRHQPVAEAAIRFKHDARPVAEALPELLSVLWQTSLAEPVGQWLDKLSAAPKPPPKAVGGDAP